MAMATMESKRPFREIRAIHDDKIVRVYQAYNDTIADLAVEANSFTAPRDAGAWSASRMTWIKPSAIWMAYRCGWTTMKDRNQSRVLALDVDRARFEQMLMAARLSHSGSKANCRDSEIVVQWDPERKMDPGAGEKNVFTRGLSNVRSIQIGLRGRAVRDLLLDATFVLHITDVTSQFLAAGAALSAGDVKAATHALWPGGSDERPLDVPAELRIVLAMDVAETVSQPLTDGGPSGNSDTHIDDENRIGSNPLDAE